MRLVKDLSYEKFEKIEQGLRCFAVEFILQVLFRLRRKRFKEDRDFSGFLIKF